jgi:hypothetical protein
MKNKGGEGTIYYSCWHCMEVSRQLQASVVYTQIKKHPRFGLYAYMNRKIPFLYRESKDDDPSATLPVVHSPFHLSYPDSEETGKYEAYEIKGLLQNYYAVTSFGFIYFPQSFQIMNPRSIYVHVSLRCTTF